MAYPSFEGCLYTAVQRLFAEQAVFASARVLYKSSGVLIVVARQLPGVPLDKVYKVAPELSASTPVSESYAVAVIPLASVKASTSPVRTPALIVTVALSVVSGGERSLLHSYTTSCRMSR